MTQQTYITSFLLSVEKWEKHRSHQLGKHWNMGKGITSISICWFLFTFQASIASSAIDLHIEAVQFQGVFNHIVSRGILGQCGGGPFLPQSRWTKDALKGPQKNKYTKLVDLSFSHRIRGTIVYLTYMKTIKSTIHVGKHNSSIWILLGLIHLPGGKWSIQDLSHFNNCRQVSVGEMHTGASVVVVTWRGFRNPSKSRNCQPNRAMGSWDVNQLMNFSRNKNWGVLGARTAFFFSHCMWKLNDSRPNLNWLIRTTWILAQSLSW